MAKGDLVEVRFDENSLRRVRKMLSAVPRKMGWVMRTAINKTAKTARVSVARRLATVIKVKVGDTKKRIIIYRATNNKWEARLTISEKRLPLIQFAARQTKKGVGYQIDKSAGRKTIRSAFIRTMPIRGATQKHGHRGVFMRKGKARLPIREKFGPSIGIVFERAPGIAAEAMAETGATLEKNVYSQVGFVLSRLGRAG